MNTILPDTLLSLIHDDGYSTGEASIFQRGRHLAYIDASKDGERWVVFLTTDAGVITI